MHLAMPGTQRRSLAATQARRPRSPDCRFRLPPIPCDWPRFCSPGLAGYGRVWPLLAGYGRIFLRAAGGLPGGAVLVAGLSSPVSGFERFCVRFSGIGAGMTSSTFRLEGSTWLQIFRWFLAGWCWLQGVGGSVTGLGRGALPEVGLASQVDRRGERPRDDPFGFGL